MRNGLWRRAGVYIIRNERNGKVYIGSSINLCKRRSEHFCGLRRGDHPCVYLQRAYHKHGEAVFKWEVLEFCEPDEVMAREQYWADHYRSYHPKHGYNRRTISSTSRGVTLSDETRLKMSAAHKGRRQTPEHARKQCEARRGRRNSPDKRLEMGAANRRVSEETAREIVRLLEEGKMKAVAIARDCGVSQRFVSKVKLGRCLWIEALIKGTPQSYVQRGSDPSPTAPCQAVGGDPGEPAL